MPPLVINEAMVESMVCYCSEVWFMKREEERKQIALEMDYLVRSNKLSTLQLITNFKIRSKIKTEKSMLDSIQRRQLKMYGPLHRMDYSASSV